MTRVTNQRRFPEIRGKARVDCTTLALSPHLFAASELLYVVRSLQLVELILDLDMCEFGGRIRLPGTRQNSLT